MYFSSKFVDERHRVGYLQTITFLNSITFNFLNEGDEGKAVLSSFREARDLSKRLQAFQPFTLVAYCNYFNVSLW